MRTKVSKNNKLTVLTVLVIMITLALLIGVVIMTPGRSTSIAYATPESDVDDLIDAIGSVEYTQVCENKIDAANNAYNGLTDEQKALVTKYDTLTKANGVYAMLKTYHELAEAEEARISAIGTVQYTSESKAKIDWAREGYDALTDAQKALVRNYSVLTNAEEAYLAEQAYAADALIDDIGQVDYTAQSKAKIDAAREAFDALTEGQKALIGSENILTAAEERYAIIKADNEAANVVKDFIKGIGTVVFTAESKAKIDTARAEYGVLTPNQQALVNNVSTLLNAEAAYNKLVNDNEAANAVKALIDSIGEVTLTPGSKAKIDAAMRAFNALSTDQKNLVANKADLWAANSTYVYLGDKVEAQRVIDKIDNIGKIKYPDSKQAIVEARDSYDELSDSQKELVENYAELVKSESGYQQQFKNIITYSVLGLFGVLLLIFAIVLLRNDNKI